MKHFISIIASAFLFLASHSAFAADHVVKMMNAGTDGVMVFEPGVLKAAVGDTVTFQATDVGHNTASKLVPDGAVTWQGSFNEEVKITLDKEGIYIYQCDPHMVMAMVGVIQVGAPTNLDAAKEYASGASGQFVMNNERLNDYIGSLE
ncbi:MAG: pseudoazurin [Pseudomonadota bacterium]